MKSNKTKFDDQGLDSLSFICSGLPELPNVVRYYDDFDEVIRTINEFREADTIWVLINGKRVKINFNLPKLEGAKNLIKQLFLYFIAADLRISTIYGYMIALNNVEDELITDIVVAGPQAIKDVWKRLFIENERITSHAFPALKGILGLLAQNNLSGWSKAYLDFIAVTLPHPDTDKYVSVRTGDAFLSSQEEAVVVTYLDRLARQATTVPDVISEDCIKQSVNRPGFCRGFDS